MISSPGICCDVGGLVPIERARGCDLAEADRRVLLRHVHLVQEAGQHVFPSQQVFRVEGGRWRGEILSSVDVVLEVAFLEPLG